MNSLFFKMGLTLALLVGWVVYDRWDTWASQTTTAVEKAAYKVKSSLPTEPPTDVATKIYKWQDAQGRWQFSNEPPETHTKVATETYHSSQNILPRITAEEIGRLTRKTAEVKTSAPGLLNALPNAANAARDTRAAAQ